MGRPGVAASDHQSLAEMGGGRLGANGSHQIDLLRFWLGEIAAVSGEVRTLVPDRVDPRTGERWTATADDMVGFTAEMASGAVASVFLSGAARHNIGNSVHIFGSEGTIMLADRDERCSRPSSSSLSMMTFSTPAATLP